MTELNDNRLIRVFIVEDDPLFRQGYTFAIDKEPGFRVCGSALTGPEAIEKIPESRPDLVLIDISLVGMNGIELIKHIRTISPTLKTLVVTGHDDVLYAQRSLRAGARGYLLKTDVPSFLFEAIRSVLQGQFFISTSMRMKLLEHRILRTDAEHQDENMDQLTDRELEVFSRLGNGLTNRQIADNLFISPKTVETYLNKIRKKLRAASMADLRVKARTHHQRTGDESGL